MPTNTAGFVIELAQGVEEFLSSGPHPGLNFFGVMDPMQSSEAQLAE